jgi:ABC-type sugar transport system ATPase subunit
METPPQGQVICGFRPEHLEITPGAHGSGTVVATETLGHQTIIHCNSEFGRVVALVDREQEKSLALNTPVTITPRMGQFHLFSADSGDRLN